MRNKEKRELGRTFDKIESWDDFLARWEAIETVQEAVGLLYAAPHIFPFNLGDSSYHTERTNEIGTRINFFLRVAQYKDPVVSVVAQQLIVKSWLKRMGRSTFWYPTYFAAHTGLWKFLLTFPESILKPPYPRFVREYLAPIHEEWRHGSHPNYLEGEIFKKFQEHTEVIVKMLCTWGLSEELGRDGLRPETKPIIKEFLDDHKFDPGKVLMDPLAHVEMPADFSSQHQRDAILYAAARTYLKLIYWTGPGVHLEFNKVPCL